MVNPRTARDLELEKVLEHIAPLASSPLGAEAVRRLEPSPDRPRIEEEFALVEQMEMAVREGFSPGAISDLRPLVEEARTRGNLRPEQFLIVAETLEAAAGIAHALCSDHTPLGGLARRLSDQTQLLESIRRAIDDRGEIREAASQKHRTLVRERRALTEEITEALQRFLDSHRNLVQEPVITQRGSRFVVPLRSGAQGMVPVVVHDISQSGQTVFAEPEPVVRLNNRLREVEDDIWRERLRILAELAGRLLHEEASLTRDRETLARLDSLYARARYALAEEAMVPKLTQDGRVELVEGRHPLLGTKAVPISIAFGREKRLVVITGPNTGGKTVTLKTIGLLTLMAQCGIPIPASPRTTLTVWERVRSDIGEEQSIEQSLSTFSSHMKNIIGILSEADDQSLVLLDELGAGTDPQEGAALGLAILEQLLRLGCTAAVATHLGPVKNFAISHPGVLSCSMEFDLRTLSPTFRVLVGVPGSSCALSIAERLGLSRELVTRARERLSRGEIQAEEIIGELQREWTAARRVRADLQAEREAVRRLREEYERWLSALREKKTVALGRELSRLEEELRAARKELSELIARARAPGSAEERRRILRRVEEIAAWAPTLPPAERPAPKLEEGQLVRIRSTGAVGVVRRIEEDLVKVEVRGRRVELSPAALEPAEGQPSAPARPPIPLGGEVPLELSVRGLTVAEALPLVEAWLDRLFLAGIQTGRLIHGKGTGTLRRALHEHLSSVPYVRGFHLAPPNEGGQGVTIVELG